MAWKIKITCHSIALDKNDKKGELVKFKYIVPKK